MILPPYFKQQHRALALKPQKLTLDLIEFMFYNSLSFGFLKTGGKHLEQEITPFTSLLPARRPHTAKP